MAGDTKTWEGGYRTGWCISGCHQGVVKKSPSGKEFPSCGGGGCTCYCHSALDDIMAAIASTASETGVSVPMPPAAPIAPVVTPPMQKEPAPATMDPGTGVPTRPGDIIEDHPVNVSSPPPRLGPPQVAVPLATVTRLPNGRRPKGSLEPEIEDFIRNHRLVGELTPMAVGAAIEASPGAVSAVWARWERDGKCELGKKPARFVRFLK